MPGTNTRLPPVFWFPASRYEASGVVTASALDCTKCACSGRGCADCKCACHLIELACLHCGRQAGSHVRGRCGRQIAITIVVDEDTLAWLDELGRVGACFGTAADAVHVLAHVARALADGARRPGAWERDVVTRLLGLNEEPGGEPNATERWRRATPPLRRWRRP